MITEEFTKNRDCQILLATDAAGEGLNLQAAHLMVNYDLPWNPNRIEQRFGRIHRIGQEEVCRLWNIVASNTREGDVFVIVQHFWKKPLWVAIVASVGFGILDVVFITSNLLKFFHGAWLPLALGGCLVVIMWTWNRGAQILSDKTRRDSVPLSELSEILRARAPYRAPGTAIFLTSDPDTAPVALMHNLKHNKVLHQKNIILTIHTAETPRVADDNRIRIEPVNDDFKKVIISYGFMESPNVPKALGLCRKQGLKFDIMATSFFLGRRSVVPSAQSGMPLWQDKLFIFLMKNAANPTDFYKIPPGRVVEMGTQVTV